MKLSLLPILLVLNLHLLPAQSIITGKVIEAGTGSPLPYVNIGIKKQARGTVSDEKGNYQLEIQHPDDIVTFSSIGYQDKNIRIAELEQHPNVELMPRSYDLREIEVRPEKQFETDIVLGKKIEKRKHSVGFGSSQLGTEIGALINIRKKTLLETAHFTLNHAKGDSMYFRVNIYDAGQGRIGENLLRENIIIATTQQSGTISVDLPGSGIVVKDDILLALQWIRDDDGQGNVGVTFRAEKSGAANLYTKIASIGSFRKTSDAFPGAPKLLLSFYLSGKTME